MTQPQAGYAAVQTQSLTENADRLGLIWKKRPATIVAPGSDDPTGVTAIMDGDTISINVYSLIGVPPVGTRVMCDIVPPSGIYVVGYIGAIGVVPGTILPGSKRFVAGTSTPGIGGVETAITEYSITVFEPLNTVINIKFAGVLLVTNAGATVDIRLRRDSVSGTLLDEEANTYATNTFGYTFRGDVTVIGAGTFSTYVLTAQVIGGGGTVTIFPSKYFMAVSMGGNTGVITV